MKTTALYQNHLAAGAKMVDFAGWNMPLNYGSQLQEHHQVRRSAGVFDVSHMQVVDVHATKPNAARDFLRYLLANDVDRLYPGKALYSCMLNPKGGILDDLIVYARPDGNYRLVVNAATSSKDLAWINQQATAYAVTIHPREDLAMLAVQGPYAGQLSAPLLPSTLRETAMGLKTFHGCEDADWFVGRTGYTGEDGFEIMLPTEHAPTLWDALLNAGVKPIGLGARDSLRLEAGMCLYGSDMDEHTTPYAAGLGWTVPWEPQSRDFIGRLALTAQHAHGTTHTLKGLVLNDKGVLRAHQNVYLPGQDTPLGITTSGTFSPTLSVSIALAKLPVSAEGEVSVDIRGKRIAARIVKPPFVRKGKSVL